MENHGKDKTLNVIVVDDNWDFLKSAAAFLSLDPKIHVIGVATSGGEALDLIKRLPNKADVILTDLAMPGMNGLELTRRLKLDSEPPRVVILSLLVSEFCRSAAIEAGADAIVEKSEVPDSLFPTINDLFTSEYAAIGGTSE